MKTHVRWLLPLIGAVVAYFLLGPAMMAVSGAGLEEGPEGLLVLGVLLAWAAAVIVLSVRAVRNGYRVFRAFRRSRGHFTRSERAQADLQRTYEAAWDAARMLTWHLSRNRPPPPLEVWGIVTAPDEAVHLQITADYARFYGTDGTYMHTSGFFWGHPAFVLAGLGINALTNSRRRQAAEAAARERWREIQRSPVFLTNRRIICQANGRWLSFYYSTVTACYPEPENNSIVLEFHGAEPLLIGGPEAPLASAYLVWALHGERGVATHPALEILRR